MARFPLAGCVVSSSRLMDSAVRLCISLVVFRRLHSLPGVAMAWWKALQRCLYIPRRIALLLGLGAFSAAGAHADAIPTQGQAGSSEDLQIRVQGGELFLSEKGGKFRRVELRDSGESRALMRLLGAKGASSAGASTQPIILAGSGGAGFHWAPAERPAQRTAPKESTAAPGQKNVAPAPYNQQRPKGSPKASGRDGQNG